MVSKRILSSAAVLGLTALFFISCSGPKQVRIEILTTNDVHGRWFDESYDGQGAQKNSLLAVNWYVDSVRTAAGRDHVILIDAGDCLQGDNAPYYYNYVDTAVPHLFPRLMTYMGYDAVCVGNHDIETGHPVYDRVRRELEDAGIPFLGGNAIDRSSGKPYFTDHVLLERDGVRILLIGYTNANIRAWLDETLWSGLDFEPLVGLVQGEVDALRQELHPDAVIVATHTAVGEGDGTILESEGLDLFQQLRGVDFLICSHDHRPYVAETDSLCLIDSGSHARNLGHGTLTLELDAEGKVVSKKLSAGLIPVKAEKADPAMREAFRKEFETVKAFSLREVGTLTEELRTRDAYVGESLYIDFIHLITLLSAKSYGADLSLAAPLTFNGTIEPGVLVYNDLFTIYPFENQLFVAEMTGREIKDYLEWDYDQWIQPSPGAEDPLLRIVESDDPRTGQRGWSFVGRSYNFDSAGGLNYVVDVTKPAGARVRISGFADGRPFSLGKTYRVAMTSYRANGGGGGLTEGAGIPAEELDGRIVARLPELRELIYQFLQNDPEGAISPELIARYKKVLGSWQFVPAAEASDKLKRDLMRLFGGTR